MSSRVPRSSVGSADCAAAKIDARLRHLSLGNLGDVKPIRGGLHELRVHHGPGYRVYVLREGQTVIVLCAGNKASQERDIERAGKLADDWRQR